jgi:hypothetical protein
MQDLVFRGDWPCTSAARSNWVHPRYAKRGEAIVGGYATTQPYDFASLSQVKTWSAVQEQEQAAIQGGRFLINFFEKDKEPLRRGCSF